MPTVIDLSNLASVGFIIRGDAGGDRAGYSVSNAGDVNGDGLDDFIIGAPLGDDSDVNAGEAYVIFGRTGGFGTIDLSALTAADGFVIRGAIAFDEAGFSVSAAGDFNNDGYADLIIGAALNDTGGDAAGAAYVVFGHAGGFGTIDLGSLAPADGFTIFGDSGGDLLDPGDSAGWSVSSAGDVNGDGFDDVIIGAPTGNDGGTDAGEAYVLFGSAGGFADIDLTTLAPAAGFVIQGDASGDNAGYSVSSAGDINNDGIDDLIVGAPRGDNGGSAAGEAYVIYGRAGGFGAVDGTGRNVLDLTALAAADGFTIQGDAAGDVAGWSVSNLGDVNGDGIDDIAIGARLGGDGGVGAGETYVIFGKTGGFTDIDLTTFPFGEGFIIQGATGDQSGHSVSAAGDVNGDGFADILIGAPANDDGGGNAGVAYVVFGNDSFSTGLVDLSALAASQGFIIQGDTIGDQAGFSVSAAGDINGDGLDDLIVGAPYGNDGGNDAGEAYIIFGQASTVINLGNLGTNGIVIQGDGDGDNAGWSVSDAGDVNGDGIADFIVGAPGGNDDLAVNNNQGEAYVIFGKAGLTSIDLTSLTAADGFLIRGDTGFDNAGVSVSSAGDLNNDGFDDLVVGAPSGDDGGDDAGEAYVIFGKAAGFGTIDLSTLALTDGFVIQGDDGGGGPFSSDLGDAAGYSISAAGDINGDGFEDLLVGAPFGDDGGTDAGETYVIFGHAGGFGTIDPSGRNVIDLATLAPTAGFIIQGNVDGDNAGLSVSSAGDVNDDGIDDLIIGAPRDDAGGLNAGQAYVVFGRNTGFGAVDGTGRTVYDLTTFGVGDGFIIQGDITADLAGWSVSGVGDVNGDGFDDVVVGAKFGDDGGSAAGEAYVVFGKADGVTVDLTTFTPADGFIIQGDTAGDQLGLSVSGAGDFNGDGFADLIVGALFGDDAGPSAGEAYIVFGSGSGFGTLDLDGRSVVDLSTFGAFGSTGGLIIQGDNAQDNAGRSVSAAGDVNNDGFDDVLVGAPQNDDGGPNAGAAYVIFGRADPSGAIVTNVVELFDETDTLVGTFPDIQTAVNAAANDYTVVPGPGTYTEAVTYELSGLTIIADSAAVLNSSFVSPINGYAITVIGGDLSDNFSTGIAADLLDGGGGADTMAGGFGNDIYLVDNSGDVVLENVGFGTDAVYTSVSYALSNTSAVETLSTLDWAATTAIALTGNNLHNYMIGNAGANVLDGGAGLDFMQGREGNDTYIIDSASDVAYELVGEGIDAIYTSFSYTLSNVYEIETLATLDWLATTAINLTGNALNNYMIGNAGANVLDGGAGADFLQGREGNDIYIVDNAGDIAYELASQGSDAVYTSVSYSLNDAYEVETLSTLDWAAVTAINLTGNSGANYIIGNAGVNVLDGKGGNDILQGKGGADTFQFTSTLGVGNVDQILDMVSGTDKIALDDTVFTGLTPGALPAGAFVTGSAAADADDRIIYNSTTGQLFFDADGSGAGVAVLFATVTAGTPLVASDFTVI